MVIKRSVKKSVKKSYRKKVMKKPNVSVAVKKYVNRMIHTDQENKVVNFQQQLSFGNSLNNSSLYAHPILPYTGFGTISQGITQGTRIGNEIKIRKVMLKYVLRPTGYDVGSNPFPAPVEVEMFLGRTRGVPGEIPVVVDFNNLFQSGGTTFGPAGNLNDLLSEVNLDYWTIKKRWRHKIGFAGNNGTGAIAASQYFNNNDFKLNVVKKLNITKLCPKTLKFNDSNNTVQGPGLFFFYQALNAGGGTNGSTALPCHITYWIDIHYEDA